MACRYLLVVAVAWELLTVLVLVTLMGLADGVSSAPAVLVYWGALLLAPVCLGIGAWRRLAGRGSMVDALLLGVPCGLLTLFFAQATYGGIQRASLQSPARNAVYIMMLILAVVADLACVAVLRPTRAPD